MVFRKSRGSYVSLWSNIVYNLAEVHVSPPKFSAIRIRTRGVKFDTRSKMLGCCSALWVAAAHLTPATRTCSTRFLVNQASLLRASSSRCRAPRVVALALSTGKGFGGGEATRDPAPTACDSNDPKGKQQAIHKAESFSEYLARRQASAPAVATASSLPYVPLAAPAPVAAPAADDTGLYGLRDGLSRVRAHDYSCIDNGQPFVAPGWVSDELLDALRADARTLLAAGRCVWSEEACSGRAPTFALPSLGPSPESHHHPQGSSRRKRASGSESSSA